MDHLHQHHEPKNDDNGRCHTSTSSGLNTTTTTNNNNNNIGQLLSMLNDMSSEETLDNLLVVSSSEFPLPIHHPSTCSSSSSSSSDSSIIYSHNTFLDPNNVTTTTPSSSSSTTSKRNPEYFDENGDYFDRRHMDASMMRCASVNTVDPAYEGVGVMNKGLSSIDEVSSQMESHRDDKYWERRRKNNMAAKKSRDARRVRENQLRLKVLCLENANQVLRTQIKREREDHEKTAQRLKREKDEKEILIKQISALKKRFHITKQEDEDDD